MGINRILITKNEQNYDIKNLIANITLPEQLSENIINELIAEFKEKLFFAINPLSK